MAGTKVETPAAQATSEGRRAGQAGSKARSAKVVGKRTATLPTVAAKPVIAKKAGPAQLSGPKEQAKLAKSGKSAVPAAVSKPERTAKTPAAGVAQGKGRQKMVRDSFTMPRGDHELIAELKQRSLARQRVVKKSELLRAGLHALSALSDAQLLGRLDALAPVKTGRPKKG
jgi:hypothetical protein